MAKKLKDYYDHTYLENFANKLLSVTSSFDKEEFLNLTKAKILDLKFSQRQDLVARALAQSIHLGYEETLEVFSQILGPELRGNAGAFTEGWWLWPVGRFVELYGPDYFQASIDFSKELTKRFTSEFCMRPLIKKYPERSLTILKDWSQDDHERVRRLSSECLRIRLPWAKKMTVALDYFDDYVEILSNLKDDKDKYIQKSVANNLNDLYKEDPNKFYSIIHDWQKGQPSKECLWVIKHGSRNVEGG